MKQLSCFKAYDIRGRLGDELDEEIAYRIGRAYGETMQPAAVVVGGDVRATSEALKMALADGLLDSGVNVIDIGCVGTEEIYFATSFLNLDGGVEVTASHNPIDYNGMKLVTSGSRPISRENGLLEIKRLAEKNQFAPVDSSRRGHYSTRSLLAEYIAHLMTYIDLTAIKPMKLVVNAGNGAAGHVIDAIEAHFASCGVPVEFIKIHHEADSSFPHGIPNPLLPENRQATIDAIVEHQADLGIAWDGDFDRCFLFDEHAAFIEGYYIVGLLAAAYLHKHPGAKIIHDPRLTWNTIDVVRNAGGIPVMSKTGHAFIKQIMRQENAVYGGEMSGHHYFRDFFYCDSGMIPWLLVIEMLSQSGETLSKIVADYVNAYPSSGELNVRLEHPQQVIASILSRYEQDALVVDKTDGVSVEFAQWRFNLRLSNTEPVVRLNVETRSDPQLLRQKTDELMQLLT